MISSWGEIKTDAWVFIGIAPCPPLVGNAQPRAYLSAGRGLVPGGRGQFAAGRIAQIGQASAAGAGWAAHIARNATRKPGKSPKARATPICVAFRHVTHSGPMKAPINASSISDWTLGEFGARVRIGRSPFNPR